MVGQIVAIRDKLICYLQSLCTLNILGRPVVHIYYSWCIKLIKS